MIATYIAFETPDAANSKEELYSRATYSFMNRTNPIYKEPIKLYKLAEQFQCREDRHFLAR
jgi:hypothetical protein